MAHILLVHRTPHQTIDPSSSHRSLKDRRDYGRLQPQRWLGKPNGWRRGKQAGRFFKRKLSGTTGKGTPGDDNFLDLAFNTVENLITQVAVEKPLGTSNHNIVTCFIQLQTRQLIPNSWQRLNFRLANFGSLKTNLVEVQPSRSERV